MKLQNKEKIKNKSKKRERSMIMKKKKKKYKLTIKLVKVISTRTVVSVYREINLQVLQVDYLKS